eukprot:2958834-Pleurochrysis_carterae.AAC.5
MHSQLIGVQSFSYAIEHDCWHARASSLQPLFEAAAADMGRPLDAKVQAQPPALCSRLNTPQSATRKQRVVAASVARTGSTDA